MKHPNHRLSYNAVFLICLFLGVAGSCKVFARPFALITPPQIGIDVGYEFEEEIRRVPGLNRKDIISDLRVGADLESKGWIYHPALFDYQLSVAPEFSYTTEKHSSDTGTKMAVLEGYFAEAEILKLKPYNLRLYGSRTKTPIRSAFSSISETLNDIFGAQFKATNLEWPVFFNYLQISRDKKGFFSSEEEVNKYQFRTNKRIGKSATTLTANYEEREFSSGGQINRNRTLDSYFNNYYRFGDEEAIALSSNLSQRISKSDTASSRVFQVSENLNWQHRENLNSSYRFNFNYNKSGSLENQNSILGAVLSHRLYENLTTTIGGDANFNNFTGGEITIYSGRLNFNYNRRIPWGRLAISAGHNFAITSRNTTEGPVQVFNEGHVLSTGGFTFLRNDNVETDSIRVTNTDGTIIYQLVIDYKIEEIGSQVRISRTLLGGIADGQQVLVTYRYLAAPDYDDQRFSQYYGVILDLFSQLNLSYNYSRIRQDLLSGITPAYLANDTSHRVKLDYDLGWSNTSLSFQDESRRSGNSTTEWSAQETMIFRPYWQLFLMVFGSYGQRDFRESGKSENFFTFSCQSDYMLFQSVKLELTAFLDGNSGDDEDSIDTGITTGVDFSFGVWTGNLKLTFLEEKDKAIENTREVRNITFVIERKMK